MALGLILYPIHRPGLIICQLFCGRIIRMAGTVRIDGRSQNSNSGLQFSRKYGRILSGFSALQRKFRKLGIGCPYSDLIAVSPSELAGITYNSFASVPHNGSRKAHNPVAG